MKIAVVLHLYYHDLWEEFSLMLKKFEDRPFDLYVSLIEGSSDEEGLEAMRRRIWEEYPSSRVFIMENRGLDIGPFLRILDHFRKMETSYDLILKLHSKKSLVSCGAIRGAEWRRELSMPLLDHLPHIISVMQAHPQIGMIGSGRHLYDFEGNNSATIRELESLMGLVTPEPRLFVGGSMFWVRHEVLEKYLSQEISETIFSMLEEGYVSDLEGIPRYTHALERIFGYMVAARQLSIVGI